MAYTIPPINSMQVRKGGAPGAGAATAQTVTPAASGNALQTDDELIEVYNATDHTFVDPSTVTISAENEITIVASTSSKNLILTWHAVNG